MIFNNEQEPNNGPLCDPLQTQIKQANSSGPASQELTRGSQRGFSQAGTTLDIQPHKNLKDQRTAVDKFILFNGQHIVIPKTKRRYLQNCTVSNRN